MKLWHKLLIGLVASPFVIWGLLYVARWIFLTSGDDLPKILPL